jgi:hypothetical protein
MHLTLGLGFDGDGTVTGTDSATQKSIPQSMHSHPQSGRRRFTFDVLG